jgi:uncharacterized phage infection (PIP) family protein YhgE
MTRSLPWLSTTLAFLVGVALSCNAAVAPDKTKVDRATKQVEQGAKQVEQGAEQVEQGAKQVEQGAKQISQGHTVVDGAKFSGENVKELFQKTFGSSRR